MAEMDACRGAVRRFALDEADVRDIEQQVLYHAWCAMRRKRLDPADKPTTRSWLFKVGLRVAVDAHSDRERRGEVDLDEHDREHAAPRAASAEDLALTHEPYADLREALDELARTRPELHEVLVAHDLDERDMHDVAAAAGIPVNTGHNRLRRARVKLRSIALRNASQHHGALARAALPLTRARSS